MARSTAVMVVWLIYIAFTFGISTEIDQPECKEVQCPLIDSIKCPDDSNLRVIQPIVVVAARNESYNNGNATAEEDNRKRREIGAEGVNITTEAPMLTSTESNFATEDSTFIKGLDGVKTTIDPEYPTLSPIDRCCPKAQCVCKEICNIPSCHNTSLVLIETKSRSSIPGQCCAEYKCGYEPNCTAVVNTIGSWLIDCQVCQCVAGQKICHRSCDEIRPPTNCLSQNLKRSFSNGESWKEDECTICECANGEKKCLTSFCKALNCENKVKLTGECCPICIDPITPPEVVGSTSASPSTIDSGVVTKPTVVVEPIPAVVTQPPPPCKPDERIIHVIEPNNEKCILYAVIAAFAILTAVFIGLYCHARSKQRSYRPVPIFDSNFNKIKSIVTS